MNRKYKAVIIDDEQKVIQLIKVLIDWERHGVEVIGEAHDGPSALTLVLEKRPDIVITDIRIPGFDGVELIRQLKERQIDSEFIIISGFKEFDYAHNAIKLGVNDYLLKPLNEVEINQVVEGMVQRLNAVESNQLFVEQMMKKDAIKTKELRENFSKAFFVDIEKYSKMNVAELNQVYDFHFKEGFYQVIILKVDVDWQSDIEYLLPIIDEKIMKIFYSRIKEMTMEMIAYAEHGYYYCLMNYKKENQIDVDQVGTRILEAIHPLKDMFKGFKGTVSYGQVYASYNTVYSSLDEAKKMICERLVFGSSHVYRYHQSKEYLGEITINTSLKHKLIQSIERLDQDMFETCMKAFEKELVEEKTGVAVLEKSLQVADKIIFVLKNTDRIPFDDDQFECGFKEQILFCSDSAQIIRVMIERVGNLIKELLGKLNAKHSEPIVIAQNYIDEHYMENINLSDVSAMVGFNGSYFSTMFKKETELSFLDYVTKVRIEAAKELLKDAAQSIDNISVCVGYSDKKHFANQFKKITGLTPAKYRKLYY